MLAPALIFLALWALWVPIALGILRNPRGDVVTGLLYHSTRLYCLWFQRARATGTEHIPLTRTPGPLIVIANHTAGVDPILVQAFMLFEPRWMMGRDMMADSIKPVWDFLGVIPVSRDGSDSTSAKEAIRHLKSGGVVGIFPEGGIESPPRTLRPFMPGVGLIIARSGAPVLPAFIRGTPDSDTAYGSFARRGEAHVTYGPLMTFAGKPAREITRELEEWYARVSGWPRADTPLWAHS